MYGLPYMTASAVTVFWVLTWWVQRSSQWRIGRPATKVGIRRLAGLNIALLLTFMVGFQIAKIAMLINFTAAATFEGFPSSFASALIPFVLSVFEYGYPAFLALVGLPIVMGSLVLTWSKHATFRHSLIGMGFSHVGIVGLVIIELSKTVSENDGWHSYHIQDLESVFSFFYTLLHMLSFHPNAFYLIYYIPLLATGGYVLSEWLEYRRA